MVVARMSRYLSVSVALAVALLLLVGVAPLPVRAVSHAVAVTLNDTSPGLVGGNSDVIHNPGCATTGTGICSLRDAVIFANAQAVGDTTTITLPAGTYTLTITGAGEDRAMTGDLDLRRNVVIAGAGAGTTIVQASPTDSASGIDRVFDVGAFGDATSATFSGVTIRHGNSVGGADGGSILVETSGSSLTLNDCVVADNQTSRNGGGISVTGGATLVLNRTTVSGNITTSTYIVNGGGIFNAGTVTVTNSTFSGNHADSDGGGGIANSGGTLTVMNSTFAGNSGSPGGGIRNDGGTLTVTNSTFSGNSASAGGGIWNYGGTPTVTSSTFAANTATGGGGIDDESGTLTATNTLIADNTATGGHGPDASADFAVNSKNNLLGIADNYTAGISNGVNGNLVGTTANPINPRLDTTLRDNGTLNGTQTLALLPSSPAINAGAAVGSGPPTNPVPVTDQRGKPRVGVPDIGAFEVQGAAPTITLSPSTLPNATLGTPYSQTITASGGTASYTFAVTSGALPPGLTLATTGTLSGTPTGAGSFTFTVTATDHAGATGSRAYTLVVPGPNPLPPPRPGPTPVGQPAPLPPQLRPTVPVNGVPNPLPPRRP